MGDASDFNQLRVKLERAREETKQSIAYWQGRKAENEELIGIEERVELAGHIRNRLIDALTSLEKQREDVLMFFRHCEKQLGGVEASVNDYFEDQRLVHLSDEAEKLTKESETIAFRVAYSFIEDATRLQQTLEQVHEYAVLGNAQYSEIDGFEELADRIIAFESENVLAIKQLEAMLEESAA